jgi:serine/threonine protein kinase
MTERSIFLEALEKEDPTARSAFLDTACAGDDTLRQRVEALLKSHALAGSFLGKLAPERVAEELAAPSAGSETQGETRVDNKAADLSFLTPTNKPGVLGRLGHYDILEVIGKGGMGIVLRAFDERLHRVVAIKVMAAQLATNGAARKRFTREAQAAAAVSHDHIVTIHAVEEAAGHPYLVMQCVSGMSLQERIDRQGPMQLTEIVRIGMQAAAGLAAAHAHGVVHRDIKPANILLENGIERVKITDFGLARAASDANLTQSGVVAGTPSFMSPEQARGEAVDARTDLFSLGSVLYAMCTGRAPFRASGSMAVLKRVCDETARPIRETNPDIPDWLVAIIDKLHAKEPAQRFQSAAEVAELLNQRLAHLQHPSIVPLPESGPGKPPAARRRRIVAVVALVCLAAGVITLTAALLGVFSPEDTPVEKNGPEGKAPPSVPAPKPDPHPFVVLGGKGVSERKFDTLAEAVQTARDGDTIEVRGNGPFVGDSISIRGTPLTIRAAEGFRPVIQLGWNLSTDAPLVLEGLELQRLGQKAPQGHEDALVFSLGGSSLHVANCRFREHLAIPSIVATPSCMVRNCEFLNPHQFALVARGKHCDIDNCLVAGQALQVENGVGPDRDGIRSVRLTRNTLAAKKPLFFRVFPVMQPPKPAQDAVKSIQVDASGNIFDATSVLTLRVAPHFLPNQKPLQPKEAAALLTRFLNWRDRLNLYAPGVSFVSGYTDPVTVIFNKLADWKQFWGPPEGEAIEGRVLYHGGDVVAKLRATPEKLTPDDFRLRPDSAGYRAGKDGKDLGADVDLVGPGPAYERWKKTPEYQQWLKDTKQVTKAAAPTAESQPFVVLGGKGVAERKFDTLANAVLAASDGDAIEIRGNGPFVSDGVSIGQRLVIRAGEGYMPSITISQAAADKNIALLTTSAALVLEGLELRRMGGPSEKVENRLPRLLSPFPNAALHIANCRLVFKADSPHLSLGALFGTRTKTLSVRNAELYSNGPGEVAWVSSSGGRCNIENCVSAIEGIGFNLHDGDVTDVSIRVRGNTFVGRCMSLTLWSKPKLPEKGETPPPIRLDFSGNVTHCEGAYSKRGILFFHQFQLKPPFSIAEAESLLPRLVSLNEQQNVYLRGTVMLRLAEDWKHLKGTRGQELADWDRFWAQKDTGSVEGGARFQGGDLTTLAKTTPERLTAKDFRLRSDSDGYRAGKDGKDLGAEVDLVGPGPAYERWKKTPEYLQWLKETGQKK